MPQPKTGDSTAKPKVVPVGQGQFVGKEAIAQYIKWVCELGAWTMRERPFNDRAVKSAFEHCTGADIGSRVEYGRSG